MANRIGAADAVTTLFNTVLFLALTICVTSVTVFTVAAGHLADGVRTALTVTTVLLARSLCDDVWTWFCSV